MLKNILLATVLTLPLMAETPSVDPTPVAQSQLTKAMADLVAAQAEQIQAIKILQPTVISKEADEKVSKLHQVAQNIVDGYANYCTAQKMQIDAEKWSKEGKLSCIQTTPTMDPKPLADPSTPSSSKAGK